MSTIISMDKVVSEQRAKAIAGYKQPAQSESEQFAVIINSHFGEVTERMLDSLAFNLRNIAFFKAQEQWANFRVIKEINNLVSEYGYSSLQEWDSMVADCRSIFICKADAQRLINDTFMDEVESICLKVAGSIHPLFGFIVSDNIKSLVQRQSFQNLKLSDPDDLKEDIKSLMIEEAKRQLRMNKFVSFDAWDAKLRSDFEAAT